MQRLKHGDLVTLLRQIAGAGQTRGAGTDDGNLVTVALRLYRFLGGMGIVPIRHETLQTADPHRLVLDAADTVHLALGLLRADTAAYGRQRAGLMDHLIGAFIVALGDLLDEIGDLYVYRAAGHAGTVLTVEAAGGFIQRLFLGVAQRHFQEVFVAYIGVLRGHLILFRAHIRHVSVPPCSAGCRFLRICALQTHGTSGCA